MFSANQFDGAFKPQRLQNWSGSKSFKERPTARQGHTAFIADDRGHLLPGAMKRGSAWPDFKGTWDLPARIPAHSINPTGRSVQGLHRLRSWGFDPQHGGDRDADAPQDAGKQSGTEVQQDGAEPELHSRPQTAEGRPPSDASVNAARRGTPPPSDTPQHQ